MPDIRNVYGLWCDDITFCQEDCEQLDCPRNQQNIRDRSVPHSFSVEIPQDCPKKQESMKSKIPDREKTINDLTDIGGWIAGRIGFERAKNFLHTIDEAVELMKEQDNEKKRIMKVIWDTLHEGLSIDTVSDQDWVYELIRHRIEDR